MMKLDDLKPGMRVCGLVPEQIVEIIQVEPIRGLQGFGNAPAKPMGFTVVFRSEDGSYQDKTLYCRDEHRFYEAEDQAVVGEYAAIARLAWEARRITNAHLFDRYHTAFVSDIELLPHQIEAVDKMLGQHPLRYLLADDPGAGKTIMAGLLIRELMARDVVRRCLILVPGNLAEQWRDELHRKFRLDFDTCDLRLNARHYTDGERVIIRLDQAKRSDYEETLREKNWDLIVCDEAHKLSAKFSGGDIDRSQRYRLGQLLSGITTHFLLMTATPHNGKDEEFQLFLQLLDRDRFESQFRDGVRKLDTRDLVLRRMKEDLVTFDSKPLFPERRAYTANYSLSGQERELYAAVTKYCREEFNKAARLAGGRRNAIGFALTILQRRLASSPEAIYQSLKRRRQRLEKTLEESSELTADIEELPDQEDIDDMTAKEREALEDKFADFASAALSPAKLQEEINTLKSLESVADSLRVSNVDSKWEKLREIWEQRLPEMEKDGQTRKLVIFTEHRATLSYLSRKLTNLLDDRGAVVEIHGGVRPANRRGVQDRFQRDARIQVLVATDAAGEGINLQRAHLMVNYDLPWNPNRIEQRFGRIHRIGQSEVCHLWNIVTRETREGAVYSRLLEKLDTIRESLGGKVFDVLGELFQEKSLRGLLREAIQYGDDPLVLGKLHQQIDNAVDHQRITALVHDRVLADDVIGIDQLRDKMGEVGEERLHGRDVRKFLLQVFDLFDQSRRVREVNRLDCGCYEIARVPGVIFDHARNHGIGSVRREYNHVCFDQDPTLRAIRDCTPEYVGPGHPLIEATASWIQAHWKRSSPDCGEALPVFLDETANSDSWRLLFYLEWAIHNADSQESPLERKAQFIEIDNMREMREVSASSYLEYQLAEEESENQMQELFTQLHTEADELTRGAWNYANSTLAAQHVQEVKKREISRLDKVESQVKESLQAEIGYQQNHIDLFRAGEQEYPHHAVALQNLRVQAEGRRTEFESRLDRRMQKIARQRHISPSGIIVQRVAFIVAASLLNR